MTDPASSPPSHQPAEPDRRQLEYDKSLGFTGWLMLAAITLPASAIAFCCTCAPLAFFAVEHTQGDFGTLFWGSWGVALLVALAVGFHIVRGLLKIRR